MTRDHLDPPARPRGISRRAFLRGSGAALALTAGGSLLEACGGSRRAQLSKAGPLLASPSHPVKWPIYPDNQPIAAGMAPERNATLKLYNWSDYIYKKVVKDFEKKYKQYGVKVQISTFNNMDEALAKIRGGKVDFDLLVPTYDVLGKLIQGKYLRPLNHSYIANIGQSGRSSRTPSTTRAGSTRCPTPSTPPASPGGSTRSARTSPSCRTRTTSSGTRASRARSRSSTTTARP